MSGLMAGKRGLIMGLANDKSLAWGIAQQLARHGAELAFSYQGEALKKRVGPLAEKLGSDFLIECDVSDMAALDTAFDTLKQRWETIDFVVHAIGFSDKTELRGKYVDTSLDNFLMTMNISAYSLVAVAKRARDAQARDAQARASPPIAISRVGSDLEAAISEFKDGGSGGSGGSSSTALDSQSHHGPGHRRESSFLASLPRFSHRGAPSSRAARARAAADALAGPLQKQRAGRPSPQISPTRPPSERASASPIRAAGLIGSAGIAARAVRRALGSGVGAFELPKPASESPAACSLSLASLSIQAGSSAEGSRGSASSALALPASSLLEESWSSAGTAEGVERIATDDSMYVSTPTVEELSRGSAVNPAQESVIELLRERSEKHHLPHALHPLRRGGPSTSRAHGSGGSLKEGSR